MGTHTMINKIDLTKYRKLVFALFGTAASAVVGFSGGTFGAVEAINVAIALVAAFQVWYVTETSDNPHGKAVISGVAAALVAAQTLIATHGHLASGEWSQIAIAGLTAAGILSSGTTAKLRLALPASYAPTITVVDASTDKVEVTDVPAPVEPEAAPQTAPMPTVVIPTQPTDAPPARPDGTEYRVQ